MASQAMICPMEAKQFPTMRSRGASSASHFKIGWDHRPNSSTVVSHHRASYPPHRGDFRREPIAPPKCAGVLNEEMLRSQDTRTETKTAYPAWPLDPRSPIRPSGVQFKHHEDPCTPRLISLMKETYPWPEGVSRPPHISPDKWYTDIPMGDPEKKSLSQSLYHQSYVPPQGVLPPISAQNQHLGSDNFLKGNGHTHFNTTHQSEYVGEWVPPARSCKEQNTSSIILGDSLSHHSLTEQKKAYSPKPLEGQRYDPAKAAAKLQRTNFNLGDGKQQFSTIMSTSYSLKKSEPVKAVKGKGFESSLPEGDQDPRRQWENVTTYHFFHREPTATELVPRAPCNPQKGQLLCLSDPDLPLCCSTIHQSDFQPPPPETRKTESLKAELQKSNITFNSPVLQPPTTTTQDIFVAHKLQKKQLPKEELQKMKYSHFFHPLKESRSFSTEQKEMFTNTYRGPIVRPAMVMQKSSVPLGTIGDV